MNSDTVFIRRIVYFCFMSLELDRKPHFTHRFLKPSLLRTDAVREITPDSHHSVRYLDQASLYYQLAVLPLHSPLPAVRLPLNVNYSSLLKQRESCHRLRHRFRPRLVHLGTITKHTF
jgi:hypothetical protein